MVASLVMTRLGSSVRAAPDVSSLLLLVRQLAQGPIRADSFAGQEADAVGRWLLQQGIGALAYDRCLRGWPDLATQLRSEMYSVAATNGLHFDRLRRITAAFAKAEIPLVLLKGAAFADVALGPATYRVTTDLDLWVRRNDMPGAAKVMQALGFQAVGKESRPPALQLLSDGELQFYDNHHGLVELHLSPFKGWWLRRTAAVETAPLWKRTRPAQGEFAIPLGHSGDEEVATVRLLAPEDMVIHLAVHLAVNHQFGLWPIRSFMDLRMAAELWPVAWDVVARRARQWRVSTATWLALLLGNQLVRVGAPAETLTLMQPSTARQHMLRRLVSVASILEGDDLRQSNRRNLLLLLLVDRPRDALRLMFRTLWPERDWLMARYGDRPNRWQHLWGVVRHGEP